jgi:hypothetical protein
MAQFPWLFAPPCWLPFVSPLCPLLLTWHPPSCDRNRPPGSQVACKLTPFAPPFTHPTPPLQIPRTPTVQRLTKTTSGIFRLLLSGTVRKPCTVCVRKGVDVLNALPPAKFPLFVEKVWTDTWLLICEMTNCYRKMKD